MEKKYLENVGEIGVSGRRRSESSELKEKDEEWSYHRPKVR
jgi:hypothetical protein